MKGQAQPRYGHRRPPRERGGAQRTLRCRSNEIVSMVIIVGAFFLVFLIRSTASVVSADRSDGYVNVRDFGAVCDGITDDTAALRRAFDYHNYRITLPAATCAFKTAPLVLDRPYGSIIGAGMWGTSRLLYIGTVTDTDLLQIGSGSTKLSGLTSTGYSEFRDFAVESAVRMTGGFAIHEMSTQFVLLQNIALGRQQDSVNLWGGFHFDQTDYTRVDQTFVTAQSDCLAVSGHGGEGHPATGPQYDLWVDHGKITGCHVGIHVGGGFDGAFFDHLMVTDNDYDLLVDETLSPHPNQGVHFGPQLFADFAHWDTLLIDDPRCEQRIYCSVTIEGPLVHAQASSGVASGAFAGKPSPHNSGHGVHIRSYPGGYVLLHAPYLQFHASSAVYGEDPCAYLLITASTLVTRNGGGIWSSESWSRVVGLPVFLNNDGPNLRNVVSQASWNATPIRPDRSPSKCY